ncbi:hypothetical protein [Pedobacter rhizosphaerae]|uniref:Uncharacterized protein n=1 Tax=Pedobacter rhizosphaerae TaxID=390241 RepID=A0A1H9TI34_9SPHI|nr:hypothetical protein [Pedobacter rhizosphaerae]SER96811.1 hypothetical protein SAMN04488023_1236 [Pedobacter rhizosphaerae]
MIVLDLAMNSYHFNIYPIDTHHVKDCIVHFDRGIYRVHVEGKLIGMMVKDHVEKFGYSTEDKDLKPLIGEIAGHLHEKHLRKKFAMDIRSIWNVILEANFINEETLMVYIKADTDLEEFADCVRDTIYDHVEFDEHLNLVLSQMDHDEVIDIQIN